MSKNGAMDVWETDQAFSDSYVVSILESNCHQKLKLSAICNLMQETSRRHADRLGIGYELMRRINHAWMLYDLRLDIERHPLAGEEIRVETWSRGVKGLTALRDFRLVDGQGEAIAHASTSWLLFDLERGRPQKIGEQFAMLTSSQAGRPNGRAACKIVLPEGLTRLDERVVRFNEIDLNNHVNNAQYLAWIEDAVGVFLHEGQNLVGIELNFVASAGLGDQVLIQGTHAPVCPNCREDDPETQYISIVRKECGSPLVRANLEWAC